MFPPARSNGSPSPAKAGDRRRLVFAVAGFATEQLEIKREHDQLSIGGEQNDDTEPQRFCIATRPLPARLSPGRRSRHRRCGLANGLLSIGPVDGKPWRESRTIEIGGRGSWGPRPRGGASGTAMREGDHVSFRNESRTAPVVR